MKKISVILTAAAITTILGGTAALAAGSGQNATDRSVPASSGYSCSYCQDNGHCFTDADGDGICDYGCTPAGQNAADAGQSSPGSSVPVSSDDSCSYCQNNGHCFTDADGDGICDYNRASAGQNAADAEQNTSGSSASASGRHHMERNHGSGSGHHACARFSN